MAGTFRRRVTRGWRLIVVVILLAVGITATLAVRIYLAGLYDDRAPADVIIVLGAAQYNGRPSPVYQARLDHALALYREGYARQLLFTGGRRDGDRYTEADAGRLYALAHGVPEAHIAREGRGRTTWQSLQGAAAILRARGWHRALLVSDPFHAFRLRRMARDLGLTASVSPASQSAVHSSRLQLRYILREAAVYALYRIFRV
jgi:uncharacterized SAM-binding protein YcdF (DUF218 family)